MNNSQKQHRIAELIYWTKQHGGPTYEQAADIALEDGIHDEFVDAYKIEAERIKKDGGK
jgi:hypothetical protein